MHQKHAPKGSGLVAHNENVVFWKFCSDSSSQTEDAFKIFFLNGHR